MRYKAGAEQLQQVEFINMMADVDRLVEAARVLAYLAVFGSHDRRVAVNTRRPGGRCGLAAWVVACDVGRHRATGVAGQRIRAAPHRQAYTSTDEARALGIDAGEVLKTLAVRTGSGYVLVVIPASRRLDLHLVRDALADHHAPLASEEELGRYFAGYQLGALPPLGALLDCEVYVDPEVLGHDLVVFAAGSQTESVRIRTRELFASEQVTTVPLVKQAEWGSDDPVWPRRAAQQNLAGDGRPAP